MNSTIPTLGPSQIEELSAMIEGIEEENKKPLEYLLRNLVDIESISILSNAPFIKVSINSPAKNGKKSRR